MKRIDLFHPRVFSDEKWAEGYFVKKFRTTFTLSEATDLIQQSKLRTGKAKNGLFWWDYFCGI